MIPILWNLLSLLWHTLLATYPVTCSLSALFIKKNIIMFGMEIYILHVTQLSSVKLLVELLEGSL
jgi:hypothetical protein